MKKKEEKEKKAGACILLEIADPPDRWMSTELIVCLQGHRVVTGSARRRRGEEKHIAHLCHCSGYIYLKNGLALSSFVLPCGPPQIYAFLTIAFQRE